tara:strand:+ start:567 stop:980 length:414 start_codon:yes stop_codon:yes gene_type:complete
MVRINNKERKAWLRIVEAFLAILIIMGAVLVLLSRQEQSADISQDVYEKQRQILELISKNDDLRQEVILGNDAVVSEAILNLIPSSWDFAINICGLNDICPNPGNYENKEIFATEIIITSTLLNYNPKKLRFFVWMK